MYAAAAPVDSEESRRYRSKAAAVVGDGDGSETDLGAKEVLPAAAALRPPMVQHPAVWLTDMADRVALHKRASEFARVYAERHFALELERHQRLAQKVEAGTSAVQTEPEIDEKHPDILAIRSQLPELEARIGKAKDVESEAHKAFQLAKKNYNEARQARKRLEAEKRDLENSLKSLLIKVKRPFREPGRSGNLWRRPRECSAEVSPA